MKFRKSQIPDFKAVVRAIKRTTNEVAEERIAAFAAQERKRFQDRIETQDFPSFRATLYEDEGTNLAPSTLTARSRYGLGVLTMLATGHYVRSIRVLRRRIQRGTLYHVGFDRLAHARKPDGTIAPIELYKVAAIQEHGSAAARIPARPHWRPHYRDMRTRAPQVRQAIKAEVMKRLKAEL